MDVRAALTRATVRLDAAGVASPRVDAELLLAQVLAIPRSRLIMADALTTNQTARFETLLSRRLAREPLQYLLGTAAFRGIEVAVGPGVFVPRPETELLIDLAATALRGSRLVVDLCSGSGALALAVAAEYPAPRVVAVERDAAALNWLRRNVAGTRVEVVAADIADLAGLADPAEVGDPAALAGRTALAGQAALAGLARQADVVLCNPPYVPSATAIGPEVAYDPAAAVFAGAQGLDLMPTVSRVARQLLGTDGLLAVEHDETQAESVPALLRADGWTHVIDHRDLTGRPRFTTAVRPSA